MHVTSDSQNVYWRSHAKWRSYKPLRSSDWYHERQEPFRSDCAAMRLTCKLFSTLRTPAAALFYDFNVLATRHSLDKLEMLAQHPVLSFHVCRLVFCRPMFRPGLAQGSEYRFWLRRDRGIKRKALYAPDQEDAGLRAYKAALRKQEKILHNGTYTAICGHCISRFPRVSSIFVSDGIPPAVNLDRRSDAEGPTLLQRQHPDVLLTSHFNTDQFESADYHVGMVLEALAPANTPIKELVTYNEWGPSYDFSMDNVPQWRTKLDLSMLSRLDLCLRDTKQLSSSMDWSTAVVPLLERMSALNELYLRFCARKKSFPTITALWKLNIPNLTILAVEGFNLMYTAFCNFLSCHDRLR